MTEPSIIHTDYFGTPLKVGDTVAYMPTHYRFSAELGTITKLNPCKATICSHGTLGVSSERKGSMTLREYCTIFKKPSHTEAEVERMIDLLDGSCGCVSPQYMPVP